MNICTFTSGIDDMKRKDQGNDAAVLRVLDKCRRFSVFDATANATIVATMTRLVRRGLIDVDNSPGYPWSHVTLTEAGRAVLRREAGRE